MTRHLIIFVCAGFILNACVQAPVFKGEDYAYISSSYPIVRVNGEDVEPAYSYDLMAGENTLVIVFHTYLKDYVCTFTWTAKPGVVYEVTDQDHRYPLTLYVWEPTNSYWASRLDPVEPSQCVQNDK